MDEAKPIFYALLHGVVVDRSAFVTQNSAAIQATLALHLGWDFPETKK